jgi:uncharacterized protein YukE
MVNTAPLGGPGAASSALQSPPKITDVIQQAEQVQSNVESLSFWIELASNEMPKIRSYLSQIIANAQQYLHEWVTAQPTVNQAAVQWGNQAGQLQVALSDCQTQVSEVQKHWSGAAADSFSIYATELLGYISNAAPAFTNVSNDLGSLGDSIGHLNIAIIAGGAEQVLNFLQASADVVNQLIQSLPSPTVVIPPLWLLTTVSKAATTIADRLLAALQLLTATAQSVTGYLDDIDTTSMRLEDDIRSKVPLPLPPEPAGLSTPSNWTPD